MAGHDEEPLRQRLTFDVAFRQIGLFGDNSRMNEEDRNQIYSKEAYNRVVGASRSHVAISTERDAGLISLDLELRSQPPSEEDLTLWDSVAEVSLEMGDEGLVISTPPGDEFYEFPLARGPYRVRVYVSGAETVNALGTEGQDRYRVVLWPAPYQEPVLIQKRVRRRFE